MTPRYILRRTLTAAAIIGLVVAGVGWNVGHDG